MRALSSAGCDRIRWFDDFLSSSQRKEILNELRFAYWHPSTVTVEHDNGRHESELSTRRVSNTTDESWFTPELLRCMRAIDRRVESLVPAFRKRRELWQATRYPARGKFEYHYDAGHWAREASGEREWTVLIYLNTPRAGGGTHFGVLDVKVAARAGRLLAWQNIGADCKPDTDMMHAGLPVRIGSKTVLVTWVRQRVFNRRRT